MSNHLMIAICKFTDYNLQGEQTDEYFGYRIYDDYASDYCNQYATLAEVLQAVSPENVLDLIETNHAELLNATFPPSGLWIGADWFEMEALEQARTHKLKQQSNGKEEPPCPSSSSGSKKCSRSQ